MNFDTSNLTFVMQGAIDPTLTPLALESIRMHFPESPLILSTWEGAATDGLNFDRLVLSKDPGAVRQCDNPPILDNVNRLLISSRAGLSCVRTSYAVKTRTDFCFRGRGFLNWLDAVLPRNEEHSVFSRRVVIPNYNVKNPSRIGLLFHPSDMVAAGRTGDVARMFSAPLREASESRFYEDRARPKPDFYPALMSRFTAEQHVWLGALDAKGPGEQFRYLSDLTPELKCLSEQVLINNFVVLSPAQFGLRFPKYPYREYKSWTSYTHLEWADLVDRYLGTRLRGYTPDFEKLQYGVYQALRATWRTIRNT